MAAPSSSDCACFSLCHPEEARHFFNRLPVVTSEESPWYAYLLAVYHTDSVPLPFDLRNLGAFYLPLDAAWFGQLHIPWAGLRCNSTDGRTTAPQCARAECERWLNLSDARNAQVRTWEREPIAHPLGATTVRWPKARSGAVRRDPNVLWPAGGLPLKAWSFALTSREAQQEVILMGDINSVGSMLYRKAGAARRRMEPYVLLRFSARAEARAPPAGPWIEVLRYHYRFSPEGLLCESAGPPTLAALQHWPTTLELWPSALQLWPTACPPARCRLSARSCLPARCRRLVAASPP